MFIEINDIENGFLWIFKEPKRLRMASYNLWVQNQEILVSIGFEILELEKFNRAQMHKQLRAVVEPVARYSDVTLDKYPALEFINRTLSRNLFWVNSASPLTSRSGRHSIHQIFECLYITLHVHLSIRTLFKNDSLEQIFRINTYLLNTNSRDRKSEKTNKMYKYDRNKRKYTRKNRILIRSVR